MVDEEFATSVVVRLHDINDDEENENWNYKEGLKFYNLLKQSPKIIETSHLNYKPAEGSIYNGTDFIIPENLNIKHELIEEGSPYSLMKRFVYLLDNVCMKTMSIVAWQEELILIYQSNPTFVEVTETEE